MLCFLCSFHDTTHIVCNAHAPFSCSILRYSNLLINFHYLRYINCCFFEENYRIIWFSSTVRWRTEVRILFNCWRWFVDNSFNSAWNLPQTNRIFPWMNRLLRRLMILFVPFFWKLLAEICNHMLKSMTTSLLALWISRWISVSSVEYLAEASY